MKKIYIVTKGEYSDYHICGVFSNKKLASKFINSFNKEKMVGQMRVEEYSLNLFGVELAKNYKPYFVRMDKDGDVFEVKLAESNYAFCYNEEIDFDAEGSLCNYCYAKNDKHAIKITNEKRVQIIATNSWGKSKIIEAQIKEQLKQKKTNALPEIIGRWPGKESYEKLIKMLTK